jgi:CubicO group peptidase (beta-lactamase class C family)
MKKITGLFFFAVLFFTFSYSQTGTNASVKPQLLQQGKPVAAGFSPERLKRIDDFIQHYIDSNLFNGTAAIIVQNGKIIYHKASGYYNKERKIPMRTDNIFRIASMTKPVISTAAMMLFEEGKFLLDDPLSKFIPEFKNAVVLDKYNAVDTTYTTVPAKREITIRNILSHTSGIGYAQIGSDMANAIYYKNNINGGIGTPYSTLKNVIPRLAKLPLFSQPGESFLYGLNTDVLGYLIEVISGMPLNKFLKEKLFDPLGMKDTYFFLPPAKQNRLVPLYMQAGNGILRIQDSIISLNGTFHRDFPKTAGGTYFSGGAGLSSTAYDYALFCQMLINGGEYNGVRFLSPHTIGLMTKNQIGDLTMWGNPDNPTRFGLGFGVYTEKSEISNPLSAGSFDWAGMFASHFWIDPKNKIVAVFMRNVWPTEHWDFGDRIKPLVYQALK